MSEARWRQIVSGSMSGGHGYYSPVIAPAETLARMALVVGVTAEQLTDVDRSDAAAELLKQQRNRAAHFPVGSGVDPLDLSVLTPEDQDYLRSLYERLRSQRGE